MNTAAVIGVIVLVVVLPAAIVSVLFFWAALKDGQENRAAAGPARYSSQNKARALGFSCLQ